MGTLGNREAIRLANASASATLVPYSTANAFTLLNFDAKSQSQSVALALERTLAKGKATPSFKPSIGFILSIAPIKDCTLPMRPPLAKYLRVSRVIRTCIRGIVSE